MRVSPELVDVTAGHAPRTKWQQPFDASITDVFQVQADIAGQVASALDVALGAGQKETLTEKPTQNLAAYDAFLKGEATQGLVLSDPPSSPERDHLLRAGRRTRFLVRAGLGSAFQGAQLLLLQRHARNPTDAERGQARRRAGHRAGAGPA